ncbi:hypothetical protein EES41_33490 [Streptomyces sp. ADI95-16]|nr:hypothetical protein EES41_33490 [Streptomyces sp. ADI95-16]
MMARMTPITGMDLTGFTEQEPGVWTDEQGLVLSVHFFDLVPDLPAPPAEADRLRHGLALSVARAGAGLIEASVGEVDALPAVRQLVKVRRPGGHGQVFLGSWTVPRAGCSTVVKVQAGEGPMSGVREAVILNQVGPERYFMPHPYGPGIAGGLPYHVGDHEQWDAGFPDHPLTLVRAALRRLTPGITLHPVFKALPAFGGPAAGGPAAAPAPAPAARRWLRRAPRG